MIFWTYDIFDEDNDEDLPRPDWVKSSVESKESK